MQHSACATPVISVFTWLMTEAILSVVVSNYEQCIERREGNPADLATINQVSKDSEQLIHTDYS